MQVRIGKAVTLRPEPAVGQLPARDCPTQVSDRGIDRISTVDREDQLRGVTR